MALVHVLGFVYFLMLALASNNLQAQARQLKQEGCLDFAGGWHSGHNVGGFSTYGNGERTYYNKPSTPPYPPKPPPPPPSPRATLSPPACPSRYPASPPAVDTSGHQLHFPQPPLSNGSKAMINTSVNINGVMDMVMPLVLRYDIGQIKQQLAVSMPYQDEDMVMVGAAGFILLLMCRM